MTRKASTTLSPICPSSLFGLSALRASQTRKKYASPRKAGAPSQKLAPETSNSAAKPCISLTPLPWKWTRLHPELAGGAMLPQHRAESGGDTRLFAVGVRCQHRDRALPPPQGKRVIASATRSRTSIAFDGWGIVLQVTTRDAPAVRRSS